MKDNGKTKDVDVLTSIISALKKMDAEEQRRTLQAAAMFLNIDWSSHTNGSAQRVLSQGVSGQTAGREHFSEDRSLSPKDFLRDKLPQTDVERIACLAYYLTHYRETPHFKTLDLSTLNTEAAQPKFSSASVAVDNAAKAGLLVQAIKGSKQISAAGEQYVQLLPDREAAKTAIANLKKKRRAKKGSSKKSEAN